MPCAVFCCREDDKILYISLEYHERELNVILAFNVLELDELKHLPAEVVMFRCGQFQRTSPASTVERVHRQARAHKRDKMQVHVTVCIRCFGLPYGGLRGV